jgi:hypothetical protein
VSDLGDLENQLSPITAVIVSYKEGEGRFVCDLRGVSPVFAHQMLLRALETLEAVLPDCDLQTDGGFVSVSGIDEYGGRIVYVDTAEEMDEDDE